MRIQNKLFFIILLYSSALIGMMFLLMQWSIDRGMLDYVNTKEAEAVQPVVAGLAAIYAQQQSWDNLKDNKRQFRDLLRQHNIERLLPPPSRKNRNREKPNNRRPPPKNIAVLDKQLQPVLGRISHNALTDSEMKVNQIAIVHNSQTVGWLILPKRKEITEGFELQFLEQQREAFIAISLLLIVLAIIIAFPLARHFVQPVNRLAAGTLALTQGDYKVSLPLDRRDELGQLARDFNELATTLDNNEHSRKRWLADISHELRTPLAILRGELEAIIDGIRTPSDEHIRSMQQEVIHLSKLIDDLYQLSNTDIGGLRYNKSLVNISQLIERQLNHHQPGLKTEQLHIELHPAKTAIKLWGDETRLCQLIDNLLNNSRKYTNPAGTVRVTLDKDDDNMYITIEDSAPGVPDNALGQLFDHLYRVDNSRNRSTGGSGLGLAICQQIVEAHGGHISAQHSELGGLAIRFSLPLDKVTTGWR
ncbi:ATP-binding protein [Oceanicoccus sagamiensis]|uniref:histidine kinase n=1 Tax=Oceanicoccus sagamiensis TaxID=716816 RepID=A0A1X9N678_9GAMM|nr:ATP-binding protein [Oceanicoccus sagamiensis]ARN72771.1 hypothetical protein BST96_00765 [Oceanicoccus sagamiensis]